MSSETREWLSTNTLIGFIDKRGQAWHHREGDGNTFDGAIPMEEVQRRLFSWTADEAPLFIPASPGASDETMLQVPGRKAIVRSDNGHVMGIFKEGYQPHQYNEWLLTNVASILDDDLSIGSAGLLKGGAVAWVSVEVPDTITTPEGVEFRPNLLACTSFDGSIATTYKRIVTNVVCDNTMAAALGEHGGTHKVKHSKMSMGKLSEARDALDIVYAVADDFEAEVRRLTQIDVDERAWAKVLNVIAPMPEEYKRGERTRAVTMAETKRDALGTLWASDPRVSPWAGTAYGVWQAVNTYQHHSAIVRNASRQERNMLNAVTGTTADNDSVAMNKALAVL